MNRSRRIPISAVALALALLVDMPPIAARGETLPPLYVTLVIHTEEDMSRGVLPKVNIPDYDGDEALMHHFASAMRAFAEMAADHGAKVNFGSDWTFSRGVARYEPDFYTDLQAMGHEIDAHAHESFMLYHEVREEILRAGGLPSRVASGMDEEEIREELLYFDALEPSFQILWGVALPGHIAGECVAPWAWRPSREDWTRHDPDGAYIYVGHGELVNSIQAVRRAVESRSADRVNCIALFTNPREFKALEGSPRIDEAWTVPSSSADYWENRLAWWDAFLDQIAPLVDAGVVEYATISDVADVFQDLESELVFDWDEIPRSDLPMRARNIKSGYPLED